MYHPILNKAWKLTVYIFVCGLVGNLYFFILYRYYPCDLHILIKESVVHTLLLGLLNIGIWYFIKYNRFEDKSFLVIIFTFLISSIAIIGIWIISGRISMELIIPRNHVYDLLFYNSLILKIGFGTFLFFLMSLIYYLWIYYQNYKENLIGKSELTSMLNASELSNLKSQINPHFLFNSLNSISYQIYSNPTEAHESIVKLSEYFRYSLSKGETIFTSLKDELDNVYRYLDIEKIRFTDKMNIEKEIDEQCLNYSVPVMLLQPVFENSVKHGVYESSVPITIKVKIINNSDFYTIIVSNNFDPESKPKVGTSTGLKNIAQRLKLIYKRDDLLYVTKTDTDFEVKILLPKTQNT
jgi:two-component system, LytTR family, sensor kinase